MSVTASPFLEMICGEIRLRGYSIRTEKSYLFWIKQFILFHGKRHPDSMGADEVKAFLTWLAVKRGVAVNTQKVALILQHLGPRDRLIVELLYGSGLRITEALRLRVQDIDFTHQSISVRDGKGNKDRQTLLSETVVIPLRESIEKALVLQQVDNKLGIGPSLPHRLGMKFPNAYKSSAWMFIFPHHSL